MIRIFFFSISTIIILSQPNLTFAADNPGYSYKAKTIYNFCLIAKRRNTMIDINGEIPEMSFDSMVEELQSGICSGYVGAIMDIGSVNKAFCLPKKARLQDSIDVFIRFHERNLQYEEYPAFITINSAFTEKYKC